MKVLVAGIGNTFLGDDGFGPAVVEQLRTRTWPAGVEVVDFGIRGMDLAFALTSGIDAAILVDAVAQGGPPGTLYVIEPEVSGDATLETHAMTPGAVLRLARSLGELPLVIRVIGCEPARLDDDGDISVGLSDVVTAALAPAAELVADVVTEIVRTAMFAPTLHDLPAQEVR